jgi:putative inorganic carbon (HCO3(-)) transporter
MTAPSPSAARAPRRPGRLSAVAIAAAVAVVAAGLGAGLAAAAAATSPWIAPAAAAAIAFAFVALRYPTAALVVSVVAFPIGLHHVFGPLKVAQAIALLAIGGLAVNRLLQGRAPLPIRGPLRWAIALVVVGLVSLGTAIDTTAAYRQIIDVAVGAALAAAVVTVIRDRTQLLMMCRALLLGGVVITAPTLLSARHLQAHFGGSVVTGRPIGIFSQPNELGTFSMLVLLVALGVLLSRPGRGDRVLAIVALVSTTGAMLVSLSRGSWIGATVGAFVLVVAVPRARRPLGISAAVVVIGAALLGAFAPDAPQVHVVSTRIVSLGHGEQNPYDDRPRIWREALREISARPLLGYGPDSFPEASTRSLSQAATVQADHAHDVLLTVAAETGLPGAAMLVGLTVAAGTTVLGGLALARRRRWAVDEALLGGFTAALAGLMGQGLVDFTFRNIVVAEASWVVLALALAGAAIVRRSEPPATPATPTRRDTPDRSRR